MLSCQYLNHSDEHSDSYNIGFCIARVLLFEARRGLLASYQNWTFSGHKILALTRPVRPSGENNSDDPRKDPIIAR